MAGTVRTYSGCINQWPVRENASGGSASSLPAEIYIKILEDSLAASTNRKSFLSQFALTCRYFRHLAIREQFKSLDFICESMASDEEWDQLQDDYYETESDIDLPPVSRPPKNLQFCTLVNNGDQNALALALEVRECTLYGCHLLPSWIPAKPSSEDMAYFYECLRAFILMPNLHTLCIDKACLDIESIKLISKLKQLKSLDIENSIFHKSVQGSELILKDLSRCLRLESLSSGPGQNHTLFCRFLCTRPLHTLRTMNWAFLKHVMSLRPAIQLTELEISCPLYCDKKLWAYLSLTPSLRRLVIESGSPSDDDDSYTARIIHPPNFLPNLKSLQSPLAIAIAFANQRSLKELTIGGLWIPESSHPYYQQIFDRIASGLNGVIFGSVEKLGTVSEDSTRLTIVSLAPLRAAFPKVNFTNLSSTATS